MRFRILYLLESFFEQLGYFAECMRERCAYCSCCGRNRYKGKPCVKFDALTMPVKAC